ncbi:uncharacterized protein LOC110713369 isoform X2 [Chenopodium quinoa]|uniref:uncharacterized protein LOC110713369 isoform X2 n=1 Tax=Chenopodium quinoa TaxID=63459 RepID=UPI000B7735B6|nr:uncharacterized protein LOC110713369 isoform X2 [Chenopodium quinoa]
MNYDNVENNELEMIEVMAGSTYVNCSSSSCLDSDDSLQFDLNDDLNINDNGESFDLNKDPNECSIPHFNKDHAKCSIPRDSVALNDDYEHLYSSGSGRCIGAAAVSHQEVGMEFSTWDDMNNYYHRYGEQEGFGVVCIGGRKNDVFNKAAYSTYVWKCKCYGITPYRKRVNGKRVVVYDEPSKEKKIKKCDYPVMLYGQGNCEGVWQIREAVNEHNHSVTPELSRHIVMYRNKKITKHLEYRIETDHASSASVGQIFNNMAGQRHGVENVGFTKKRYS